MTIHKVIEPYAAANIDELTLEGGQHVYILKQIAGDWWEGMTKDQVGWLPKSHVEPLDIQEDQKPAWINFSTDHIQFLRRNTITANMKRIEAATLSKPSILIESFGSDSHEASNNVLSNESNDSDEDEKQDKLNRMTYVNSFFASERRYYQEIKRFCEAVASPLYQDATSWLTSEEHSLIFSGIEEIFDFETSFMDLLKREQTSNEPAIGWAFMEVAQEFNLLYLEYIRRLPESLDAVKRLESNKMLKKFLEPLTELRPVSLFLVSSLTGPAQRYQRYMILLTDILSCTPRSHNDHRFLKSALESLGKISKEVDAIKQEQQENAVIEELRKNISYWQAPPIDGYGQWLLVGNFKVGNKKSIFELPSVRTCYLFENMLLVVKKGTRRLFETTADIHYSISEYIHISPLIIRNIEQSASDQDSFNITYLNQEYKLRCLVFSTSNDYQRQTWMTKISDRLKTILENMEMEKTSARLSQMKIPIAHRDADGKFLIPDSASSYNPRVTADFSGVFYEDPAFTERRLRMSHFSSRRPSSLATIFTMISQQKQSDRRSKSNLESPVSALNSASERDEDEQLLSRSADPRSNMTSAIRIKHPSNFSSPSASPSGFLLGTSPEFISVNLRRDASPSASHSVVSSPRRNGWPIHNLIRSTLPPGISTDFNRASRTSMLSSSSDAKLPSPSTSEKSAIEAVLLEE